MKKQIAILLFLGVAVSAAAQGQFFHEKTSRKSFTVELDWNVDFQYMFNNYEFDASHNDFDRSYTINAAKLSPSGGLLIRQNESMFHRVMLGLDIYHDMGAGRPLNEDIAGLTAYYSFDGYFGNGGRFQSIAGIYPRTFMEGDWRGPFFDDSVLFTDYNMEGMAFKYRNRTIFADIALDWMGMLGDSANPTRRERFQVLSSGDWNFAGPFHFGWRGSFYHFACSPMSPNVVDNHMLNPYIEWTPDCWFENASLNLGPVMTYQRDRHNSKEHVCPFGLLSHLKLSKWNFGIDNIFYYGNDLQPLIGNSYNDFVYGRELYFGEECFHTPQSQAFACDQLSIHYSVKLGGIADITAAAIFHFGDQLADYPMLRGSQQVVYLHVNLEKLRPSPKPWNQHILKHFLFGHF